jgi:hypothetical protein
MGMYNIFKLIYGNKIFISLEIISPDVLKKEQQAIFRVAEELNTGI